MITASNPGVSQTPLATTFQPGTSGGVNTAEQRPRENQTQPSQAAPAETQNSQQESFASLSAKDSQSSVQAQSEQANSGGDAPRGSLVDFQV